jgi:hypothetical protein
MSTTAIVVIVVVIVVVAALAVGLTAAQRRRRLRQRFGPEYDRAVGEHDSRLKAEAELTQRERRVRDLHLQPLSESARTSYAQQWEGLQEQFVDAPADAVAASQILVTAVLKERGYPTDDRDQVLADLSVDHAGTLQRYREAEQLSDTAGAGRASTEDMRLAMIHYRALFRELLGEPADVQDDESIAASRSPQAPASGAPQTPAAGAPADTSGRVAGDAEDAEMPAVPLSAEPAPDLAEDTARPGQAPADDAGVGIPPQRSQRS